MWPFIKDGQLYIPMRAEEEGIIGDAFLPIVEDDPEYATWYQEYLRGKSLGYGVATGEKMK